MTDTKLTDIKLYSTKDMMEALGVTYKTLLKYIHSGKLKAVMIGGEWKITEENYRKFVSGE